MKKQKLAGLLAAIMVLSLVGCSNPSGTKETDVPSTTKGSEQTAGTSSSEGETQPEEKEPVTIHYWYRNNVGEQQYTGDVEKLLNGMLKEMEGYEHISIDLHPCKDLATELTLAQASGDPIDMVATFGMDFATAVKNEDFITLDELMVEYPGVISELPEWMVDFGKMNGKQYFIPAYQQAFTTPFAIFPNAYLSMYYAETGKTEADVRKVLQGDDLDATLDFYEEYLLAVRKATGKETKWIGDLSMPSQLSMNVGQLISGTYGLYEVEGQEPVYWQATEKYKNLMSRMAEWYQKGYIHPDYATTNNSIYTGDNMLNDEAWVCQLGYTNAATEEYVEMVITKNIKATAIRLTEHDYIISQYAAGGNAIYTECEHPEEAMMIMELLMTKKGEEFYNTFVWGIEGTHWEWEDEANKRIKTLEYSGSQGGATSTYHAWKWNVGNSFNAWSNQAVDDAYLQHIKDVHDDPNTVSSELIGITWDLSSVSNQISQCAAVGEEYKASTLVMAGADFEKVYNEYMNKLKTAGVEKIMEVVMKQYNDFMASK